MWMASFLTPYYFFKRKKEKKKELNPELHILKILYVHWKGVVISKIFSACLFVFYKMCRGNLFLLDERGVLNHRYYECGYYKKSPL